MASQQMMDIKQTQGLKLEGLTMGIKLNVAISMWQICLVYNTQDATSKKMLSLVKVVLSYCQWQNQTRN